MNFRQEFSYINQYNLLFRQKNTLEILKVILS